MTWTLVAINGSEWRRVRCIDCERAGPFDESIQIGEFIEWLSRARDVGIRQILVPETVSRRRLHRGNIGRGGAAVHRGYARMLKKVLTRRREKNEGRSAGNPSDISGSC
jgi:hypothetical protein